MAGSRSILYASKTFNMAPAVLEVLINEGEMLMKYYLEEDKKVLEMLNTTENGLTSAEAEKRIAEKGKNKLKEAEKESLFKKFINSLADPMIIMLLIAALIQAGVAVFEAIKAGNGFKLIDFADVLVILVAVIINTVKSLVQESKAEAAAEDEKE